MDRLFLQVPKLEELEYRQFLLSDPETMSYNKGYDIPIASYNRENGCIDFPKDKWRSWFDFWVGQEPIRYYAYIINLKYGNPIGDVNIHYNPRERRYDIGIVIESKFRGLGYSVEALKLLVKYGFENCNANVLHNDFEEYRKASKSAHQAAGFKMTKIENGICHLEITKDEYFGICNNG